MTQKLNVTTLRKIRKELEERAQRSRYDEPRFESSKVAEAVVKKFAKEWDLVKKMPVTTVAHINFDGNYGLQVNRMDSERHPPKVKDLVKRMTKAYNEAKTAFEEASQYAKFTRLAEKVAALEVDVLLGSLSSDDPKVVKLLDEVRLALA